MCLLLDPNRGPYELPPAVCFGGVEDRGGSRAQDNQARGRMERVVKSENMKELLAVDAIAFQ